jgi:hypothetical protein
MERKIMGAPVRVGNREKITRRPIWVGGGDESNYAPL